MFPNTIPTNGTTAEALVVNASLNAGITAATGGLSITDILAAAVGNLLLDAAPGAGTGQAKAAKFTLNAGAGPLVASVGDLTGAAIVTAQYSTVGASTLTTRTAVQMIADNVLSTGSSYLLKIINTNAGQLTFTAGVGVTVTGTATVAANTIREFVVTVPTATTMTFQSVAVGTIS